MDCYVIRIYREKPDDPRELVGVVERVGGQGREAFTNLDELWEILNPARRIVKEKPTV